MDAREVCYTDGMTTTTNPIITAARSLWSQLTDQNRNLLTVAGMAHNATDKGIAEVSDVDEAHEGIHNLIRDYVGLNTTDDVEHCLMEIAIGAVTAVAPPEPRLESLFTVALIVRDPHPLDADPYLDVTVEFGDSYQTTVAVGGIDAGVWEAGGMDPHGHCEFLDRILGIQDGVSEYTTAGQLRRLAQYLDNELDLDA